MKSPQEIPVEEARMLLMAKLFEIGKNSIGQEVDLVGSSKSIFVTT